MNLVIPRAFLLSAGIPSSSNTIQFVRTEKGTGWIEGSPRITCLPSTGHEQRTDSYHAHEAHTPSQPISDVRIREYRGKAIVFVEFHEQMFQMLEPYRTLHHLTSCYFGKVMHCVEYLDRQTVQNVCLFHLQNQPKGRMFDKLGSSRMLRDV